MRFQIEIEGSKDVEELSEFDCCGNIIYEGTEDSLLWEDLLDPCSLGSNIGPGKADGPICESGLV